MAVRRRPAARRNDHVDTWIICSIVSDARAHLENPDFRPGSILQAVPVGIPGLEASGITCTQHFFAALRDERHLAGQHIDELS